MLLNGGIKPANPCIREVRSPDEPRAGRRPATACAVSNGENRAHSPIAPNPRPPARSRINAG